MLKNIQSEDIVGNRHVLLELKHPFLTDICLTCFYKHCIQASTNVSPLFLLPYPPPNTFSSILAFYFMVRG